LFTSLYSILDEILYLLPISFISLTIHEVSHGYVAYKLGDPTAKEQGRLTLNPLAHIDPFGLIFMILFRFGWAKPVPVNALYFKNPKRDTMLTAIAGPVSNALIGIVTCFISLFFMNSFALCQISWLKEAFVVLYKFFYLMSVINFTLAAFNMIPIHPLDGSRLARYFMPDSFSNFFVRYGTYIYIGFLVLVFATDVVSTVIGTVRAFLYGIFAFVFNTPAYFLANLIF